MALSAIRHGRTLRLVRAFTSSILPSPPSSALANGSDCGAAAGRSHLFGYSPLSGFERPSPPWRHLLARCRTWTDVRDCKHWLITLEFPNPKPTRDEMIDTYVKTLAAVVGSEEEAKRRIYGLSTTVYTGFHCRIDEPTSEKLKSQPLVNWVLSVGYGDPEKGEFGGDRYDNGVITPDPNPPIPSNERPNRKRNMDRTRFERQRDIRSFDSRDNVQMENRDTGRADNYNHGSTERRDTMQGDQFGNRPPVERNPVQGYQFGNRPPVEERNPMQGYQREYMQADDRRGPMPPVDRRDSYQGERRDTFNEGQREAVPGEGEYNPYRRGFT